MPTSYPGDRTQTQAPSAAPEPENTPTVNLPADGDAPNASAWAQPYKVLADFVHWLKIPRAKASSWAQAIMRYRSALGHTRFGIDHLGFPAGQILAWEELWPDFHLSSFTGTGSGYISTLLRWQNAHKHTSGTSALATARAGAVGFKHLEIQCGDTAGDYQSLYADAVADFNNTTAMVLEWWTSQTGAAVAHYMGLAGGAAASVPDVDPTLLADYALFRRAAGGGNWFAVTSGGGAETATDLGSGAITAQRFRIEWHGATVADDTTKAVRFYLEGALVATHTTNLPRGHAVSPGCVACPYWAAHNTPGGVQTNKIQLGPIRYRANQLATDVLL